MLVISLALAIAAGSWWYANRREAVDASQIVLYGNVDIREVDLTFNNSEHIDALLVQEGDRVHKGQLVATLHRERVQAEYAAAQAQVASRKASLARLEAGSRPQEIREAKARVAAAEARMVNAELVFERTKDLFAKHSASKQAVDDAQASHNTARADVTVAKATLALVVEGPRVEDIDEAKAMLKVAQAQLALAQEVLKDTELFAPADGIIRNRILEPGDMASPQGPVFTMALTNPVWVRTYAPEATLGKLALGASAGVSTDSYPGKTYRGWIGFISPTAEFTPKNVETPELRTRLVYQVRVYVCNPQNELRLGMPATVTIPINQPNSASDQTIPDCAEPGNG